jgi:four helix bundle protein
VGNFKKLAVWEKAHQLTLEVYKVTAFFPKDELYGLSSQMRRASSSIPANIAEGSGRGGSKEMAQFLRIAQGSAHELEYHLLLARDLNFINVESHSQFEQRVIEVQRMLAGLLSTVSSKN